MSLLVALLGLLRLRLIRGHPLLVEETHVVVRVRISELSSLLVAGQSTLAVSL